MPTHIGELTAALLIELFRARAQATDDPALAQRLTVFADGIVTAEREAVAAGRALH